MDCVCLPVSQIEKAYKFITRYKDFYEKINVIFLTEGEITKMPYTGYVIGKRRNIQNGNINHYLPGVIMNSGEIKHVSRKKVYSSELGGYIDQYLYDLLYPNGPVLYDIVFIVLIVCLIFYCLINACREYFKPYSETVWLPSYGSQHEPGSYRRRSQYYGYARNKVS